MKLIKRFNKSKYIRVIKFNSDKTSNILYINKINIKDNKLNINDNIILINSEHVFYSKGFTTILINDKSSETINPLDFNSKYNHQDFQTAINSKITKEIFTSLKTNKIDVVKLLLFANLGGILIILYYLLMGSESL